MKDKNPRGRPSIVRGESSVPVTLRLSKAQFSRASARSARERKSLQTFVRESLDRRLDDDDDDADS